MRDVLSVRQVSALTGYSKEYIRRLCRQGQLQFERVGMAYLIHADSLAAYLDGLNLDDKRVGPRDES